MDSNNTIFVPYQWVAIILKETGIKPKKVNRIEQYAIYKYDERIMTICKQLAPTYLEIG